MQIKKMKLTVLPLAVIGLILIDKTNSEGQLVLISPDEDESYDQNGRTISPQELSNIYDLAKNISHSKGPIIQSEEGDPEYRRSFVRKVLQEANFEALKLWFNRLNASSDHSVTVLQELEHLVHQYETAVDFIKLGGMEFLLPLINHTDPTISSAALSVLTAALQGNPTVQKHAEEIQILEYILKTLTGVHRTFSTSALYTLSTYLRNNPVSQIKFYNHNSLKILADILKSQVDSMRSKLKVLELVHDLASEIYSNPIDAFENTDQYEKLERTFFIGFSKANLCEIIPKHLDFDDFLIIEKNIAAMNAVATNVCSKEFKKPHIIHVVGKLLHKYNPNYPFWLTKREVELRWMIWNDIKTLYDNIMSNKALNFLLPKQL